MGIPITDDVKARLDRYLAELGAHLWDSRQRASFAMYTLGLLSELRHKSVEPIASLFTTEPDEADALHQKLLHFLSAAPWPDGTLRSLATCHALTELTRHAPVQTLIIDDTSFAKSGNDSVGVQRQYCGSLGKVANCQVVVSLTAATARAHVPIDMQLYLPKSWLESAEQRQLARIPDETVFETKPEIALGLIARALSAGVPKALVLADGAYGDNAEFRDGVRRLGLHYAVGIQLATTVKLLSNEAETVSVQTLLERIKARPFRRYSWREGTGKQLTARFAFFPVRIPKSAFSDPLWLIIERRDGGRTADRAHLCSLPLSTPRHRLVYLLKERWRTEAAYRDLKQELGLDQYQGRRYTGLAHHLTAVLCTYAFIVAERARAFSDTTPKATTLSRSSVRLQRHVPHSFPSLRHVIAVAVKPWLLTWVQRHPQLSSHTQDLLTIGSLAGSALK